MLTVRHVPGVTPTLRCLCPSPLCPPLPPRNTLANGDGLKTGTGSSGTAETPAETEDGSAAERLQAVEALFSLARSTVGGGGSGGEDGRKAALAAAAGGSMQARGERLTKTAEFLLETGFFAPADGGKCFHHVFSVVGVGLDVSNGVVTVTVFFVCPCFIRHFGSRPGKVSFQRLQWGVLCA